MNECLINVCTFLAFGSFFCEAMTVYQFNRNAFFNVIVPEQQTPSPRYPTCTNSRTKSGITQACTPSPVSPLITRSYQSYMRCVSYSYRYYLHNSTTAVQSRSRIYSTRPVFRYSCYTVVAQRVEKSSVARLVFV